MSVRAVARIVVGAALMLLPSLAHAQAPTEVVEYYALDAIGSVRVVFDAGGAVIGRMDYAPFGQELGAGNALIQQRFAGLFRDGEAGLDFAQARSFQVRTGRFGSPDPISGSPPEPQRWNRYVYSLANPLTFTDPRGLAAQGPPRINESFCEARFSFGQCGGNEYFWGTGDANGLGFGSGIAKAFRQGYTSDMPGDVWNALHAFNVSDAMLAQSRAQAGMQRRESERKPRASVSTTADFEVPDEDGNPSGRKERIRSADVFDAIADAGRIADPFTRPQVYAEFIALSAAGGLAIQGSRGAIPTRVRVHFDGPGRHNFGNGWHPAHVQIEFYIPSVRASGITVRIPIPGTSPRRGP